MNLCLTNSQLNKIEARVEVIISQIEESDMPLDFFQEAELSEYIRVLEKSYLASRMQESGIELVN